MDKRWEQTAAQDTFREYQLIEFCGLTKHKSRTGHDAEDALGHRFEIKTTTYVGAGVTTARDISLEMIDRWRRQFWIVGFGKEYQKSSQKQFEVKELFLCHPRHLEPFFAKLERKIKRRIAYATRMREFAMRDEVCRTDMSEVDNMLNIRAVTLSMRNIPNRLIRGGLRLDHTNSENAQKMIQNFVIDNPIEEETVGVSYVEAVVNQFFSFI